MEFFLSGICSERFLRKSVLLLILGRNHLLGEKINVWLLYGHQDDVKVVQAYFEIDQAEIETQLSDPEFDKTEWRFSFESPV